MVYTIFDDFERRAVHDPVKPSDRAPAWEASATVEHREMASEYLQTAAIGAPFVEIAGQQRGPSLLRRLCQFGDRPRLLHAPEA